MITSNIETLILDRDGVLVHDIGHPIVYETETLNYPFLTYLKSIPSFELLNLHIVSNQTSYRRFNIHHEVLFQYTVYLNKSLEKQGIYIDSYHYCIHLDSDNCKCRKPKIGLLKNIHLNPEKTCLIGDKISDMQLAFNYGISNMLLYNYEKYHNHAEVLHAQKSLNFKILKL